MVGDLLLLWYPVYQSAEYGRCTCEFFKKYVSNIKGPKNGLACTRSREVLPYSADGSIYTSCLKYFSGFFISLIYY